MKFTLFLLSLLLSLKSFSQKIFYSTDAETLQTETEILKVVYEQQKKFTNIFKEAYYGHVQIIETIKKRDTIIHLVNIVVTPEMEKEIIKKGPYYHLTGKEFPLHNLTNLDGNKINLEDLKGKPTFIHFWFSRCAPCIDEVPTLRKLQELYKNEFNFVTITFDSRSEVRNFLNKYPLPYMHLINAKNFIDRLNIQGYPTNIFLDKNGIVKYVTNNLPPLLFDKNNPLFENQYEIKLMEYLKL